jgi:hypothetical protein
MTMTCNNAIKNAPAPRTRAASATLSGELRSLDADELRGLDSVVGSSVGPMIVWRRNGGTVVVRRGDDKRCIIQFLRPHGGIDRSKTNNLDFLLFECYAQEPKCGPHVVVGDISDPVISSPPRP